MNKHKIIKLPNGVQIVFEKLPYLRSVAFGIWVKNGSKYETKEQNGISHFIEHLLFKGTEKLSAKDIATNLDKIGGQINAFTSKEYTCYYTKTLDTHIYKAIDVLADMYFNSKFDSEEIQKESNVILEEINMYEDSPEDLCFDILNEKVFENSSLGYPIIGTKETVKSFKRNDFIDFFKKKYTPQNTIVSVTGNFDEQQMQSIIEKYFCNFKNIEDENKNYKNPIYVPNLVYKKKDIEQIHLAMAFDGVKAGIDENYDLAILNTMLGGGMSSVLFQKVREEKGLAYSVYSQNTSYKEAGIYTIYAGLNLSNLDNTIKLILEEINNLKLDEQLIEMTKEQVKSNYVLSLEGSFTRMNSMGRSLTLLDRILTPDQVIKKIDSVNLESVKNISNKVLNNENLSISVVGNITNSSIDNIKKLYF